TSDQKFNEILKRLDRIDQRLNLLEKGAQAERGLGEKSVLRAVPLSMHNQTWRRAAVAPATAMPVIAEKPTPHVVAFNGCGAKGDAANGHGDPELNFLKNRDDQADNW